MKYFLIISLFLFSLAWTNEVTTSDNINKDIAIVDVKSSGVPIAKDGFSRRQMLKKENSDSLSRKDLRNQLESTSNFRVIQSFSMGMTASLYGSASYGLYLSSIYYDFSPSTSIFLDIGVYKLIHSNFNSPDPIMFDRINEPEIVIPAFGIEFRPTENLTVSIQVINRDDAMKAYGVNSRFWRVFDGTARFLFDDDFDRLYRYDSPRARRSDFYRY